MITTILTNVGVGLAIAVALFFILAKATRTTVISIDRNGDEKYREKNMNSSRLCLTSILFAIIAISVFFILDGYAILKTIGLTLLIYIFISIVIMFALLYFIPQNNSDDEEYFERLSFYESAIHILVISVFAVLIINHFHLI